MTVHVVIGETGECSDRVEWLAVAFLDEEKAKARVIALDEWLRLHKMHRNDDAEVPVEVRWDNTPTNPLDPHFRSDFTGTRYHIATVQVEE